MRALGVMKGSLAILALERDVDMAALAWIVVRPFGHERGHQAAALGEHLQEGLEKGGAVGRFQRLVIIECRLHHAGARLGMKALDRHAHGLAGLENLVIEIGPDRTAQHGITEESWRDRRQIAITLFAHALRRLVEDKELALEGRARIETQLLGRTRTGASG